MVTINVDKQPANIKVIIFHLFVSSEDFRSSLDTAIQIIIEAIAIIPVDTFAPLSIYILCKF